MKYRKPSWPPYEEGAWPENMVRALGWSLFRIHSVKNKKNKYMEGKRIVHLARENGKNVYDFFFDLLIEEEGGVGITAHIPSGKWIDRVFSDVHNHPEFSPGIDALWTEDGESTASAFGTFPRNPGYYVNELKVFTFEDAVRRSTSLAAKRFRITDRGIIKTGAFADLVLLDRNRIKENSAKFLDGTPDGIEYVILNGNVVVEKGRTTGIQNGGRLLTA